MKILFTGASSFTGFWFAKTLAAAGHQVVAPLMRPLADYADGVRAERVRRLKDLVEIVPDCVFGATQFMHLLEAGKYDLICHHAAQVGDYRNPDFDVTGAVAANTRNIRAILGAGAAPAILLTGSVFEPDEGAGDKPLRAFSPYGLSKGISAQIIEHYAREAGTRYGKFVIPNPFGPLEEPRFCAYLMRTWQAGNTAGVNTPSYIRDNIHIDLLAGAYVRYATELAAGTSAPRLNPSGYVESQGAFAERFAREMQSRLDLECKLDLARQTEFAEPVMRVNTQPAEFYVSDWNADNAWDAIADAYR